MDRVGEGTVYGELPNYSADKDCAQEVIRKIDALAIGTLTVRRASKGRHQGFLSFLPPPNPDWQEYGETSAHAICLGALRAVREHKVSKQQK